MNDKHQTPVVRRTEHDFRHGGYDQVNESPRQRHFRRLAPMPFGAVLIARDDMDESEIRYHLRTMRELGFNAIKQFMECDRWSNEALERMALDEGLVPWWYGEGGWEPITDDLCRTLGIDPDTPVAEIRRHPDMIKHQTEVLGGRFGRPKMSLNPEVQAGLFEQKRGTTARELGPNADLPEEAFPKFVAWLEQYYAGSIDALNRAWNCDGSYAGDPTSGYRSFAEIPYTAAVNRKEYRRIRDILRFKADGKNAEVLEVCRQARERDPHEPHRSGGEMGLFLPFASRGTDMEGIARAMKDTGSFYPSIHLCWHFEETWFEVARPVYMQASFVVDLNKGGWTAPWESTGGPQQTSGLKAYLYPRVADLQPGFTVDAGVMTQLLFSYLAAGCKGAGLWSWNARMAGWEGGEYALLDRNEKVCDRTRRVGAIATAANRYRDELWSAHKEPQVGILMDWDNEAIWAAMSQNGRTLFKYAPVEARIGASRACIDANVPFEYVTASNVRDGLASRYPVIYLPGLIALNRDLIPHLSRYVEHGGRLVADMPIGCYDETGRVLFTHEGTDFERLFGAELSDLQYSGNNLDRRLSDPGGNSPCLSGYVADLIPTSADVSTSYDTGEPAETVRHHGAGSAVIVGWEAARSCYRPGNLWAQKRLAAILLGDIEPMYESVGNAVVYRLSAPTADHWFFVNEGPPTANRFTVVPRRYRRCVDAVTGTEVDISQSIPVERDGGRWIRCEVSDE